MKQLRETASLYENVQRVKCYTPEDFEDAAQLSGFTVERIMLPADWTFAQTNNAIPHGVSIPITLEGVEELLLVETLPENPDKSSTQVIGFKRNCRVFGETNTFEK